MTALTQESRSAAMVRAFCLLLAGLLWLTVIVERPGQVKLQLPVRAEHLPAGLRFASPPPAKVEVVVAGPRILLWLLPYRGLACRLDLSGMSAGGNGYLPQDDSIQLPDKELKVVRVIPSPVPLALVKVADR